MLTRIILIDPGTIKTHPNLGVGITTRFRFGLDNVTPQDLQEEIDKQIQTYLPYLQTVDVQVRLINHVYYIYIGIDQEIFGFKYDTENNAFKSNYSKVKDLM